MPIGDVLHGIFRLNERLGPAREIRGSRFSQAGGGSFLDSDRAHIASFGCVRLSCLFSIFTVTHVLHCNAWAVQNSWMTGDPERDNCPDLVNCSDSGEKSVALLQQLTSRRSEICLGEAGFDSRQAKADRTKQSG
jgi:hypothetical protein